MTRCRIMGIAAVAFVASYAVAAAQTSEPVAPNTTPLFNVPPGVRSSGVSPPTGLTANPPPVATGGLTPSIIVPPTPSTGADTTDGAFSAYQRGFFQTALLDAQKRVAGDPKNAASLTLLGQLYTEGVATPRDLSRAADYFRRAAALGDANAAFSLGVALLEGRGVAPNRAEARGMFELAAAQNHPGALYNLGVMSLDASVTPDFRATSLYFRRSADSGNADSAYSLGVLYRQGKGVERDDAQALSWFKRAADEGNVAAMIEYGVMAFNGQGAKPDEAAAARYFLKAAQKNNPVAQNRAARLLAAGRGIPQNLVEGMKWHLLARSAGITDAWLDGQLATLTTAQRGAVEDSVRRYNGM